MKILKKGNKPEDRVYRNTCSNCRSELEFFAHETQLVSDQRDGNYFTIKCPVCGYSKYRSKSLLALF